jgi:hypothetical protein
MGFVECIIIDIFICTRFNSSEGIGRYETEELAAILNEEEILSQSLELIQQ